MPHAPIFVSSFSHRATEATLVLSRLPALILPPRPHHSFFNLT